MASSIVDRLVEAHIRQARDRGDFDDLPGAGKPLDLDHLNGLTSEQRREALVLRCAGEVSEEVALLREITATRAAIERCGDDAERERLRVDVRTKATEVAALFERRRAAAAPARKP